MMKDKRERLLYHEAGHAVAAMAYDLPFMALLQSGDSAGMLCLGSISETQLKDKNFCENYTIVSLAGAAAESIHGHPQDWMQSFSNGLGADDFRKALSLGLMKDFADILTHYKRAYDCLKENWSAVEKTVSELRNNYMLSEAEVRSIAGFEKEPVHSEEAMIEQLLNRPCPNPAVGLFDKKNFGF